MEKQRKTNPILMPTLSKNEESLQRIADSLERLVIILLQLGGRKTRFSSSARPARKEPKSTESSTD